MLASVDQYTSWNEAEHHSSKTQGSYFLYYEQFGCQRYICYLIYHSASQTGNVFM